MHTPKDHLHLQLDTGLAGLHPFSRHAQHTVQWVGLGELLVRVEPNPVSLGVDEEGDVASALHRKARLRLYHLSARRLHSGQDLRKIGASV